MSSSILSCRFICGATRPASGSASGPVATSAPTAWDWPRARSTTAAAGSAPPPRVSSSTFADDAVDDVDDARRLHCVEQGPVVGDEQQRPVERRQRLLELFDGGQVEV